jgi:Asp-tRNA(Asn)/Glu-tRNA(Gln) amidotransferase A subunit family amidase
MVYEWLKEGLVGAEGMPLNVQVIGLPWKEELVLRVMQELEAKAQPNLKLQI